jgi:hypothetical protein
LAFGGLTRVTSLTLDADFDFAEAPIDDAGREVKSWAEEARRLFSPFAASLRTLEIGLPVYGANRRDVYLPPCLSMLQGLTSLSVSAHRLVSVGPLRFFLTGLQRLDLEADLRRSGGHGPMYPRDLQPLTALEHVRLLQTDECLGPVIESGTPRLRTLVLRDDGVWNGSPVTKLPPAAVLRAARARVLHNNVQVYFADDKLDTRLRGPATAAQLEQLADFVERSKHDGGNEHARHQRHAEKHAAGLAAADAREAAYGEDA